jgi:hypothetical protein
MAITLKQTVSATGTSNSVLDVTLGSTTAGSTIVVCYTSGSSSVNPTISGVTLGGSSTGWGLVSAGGTTDVTDLYGAMWYGYNQAGGQTALAINLTNGSGTSNTAAWVYEFSGMQTTANLDKDNGNYVSSGTTSFTSNGAGTTTQLNEVWVGMVGGYDNTSMVSSGAWTDTTILQPTNSCIVAGYQIVSTTGTATFSGTLTPGSEYVAIVGTFIGAKTTAGLLNIFFP